MSSGHVTFLRIKALEQSDGRFIEGWATKGEIDRCGDLVSPEGAKFALPLPLLFAHQHDEPIGSVVSASVSRAGIRIRAKLTAGVRRADEIWTLIRDGALHAVSIGFMPLKTAPLPNGGTHFLEWSWHELSIVSVPALPSARIAIAKCVAYATDSPKREDPLPAYVQCEDVAEDFTRALATVPPAVRRQVCAERSSRCADRGERHWIMRDLHGAELARVPPLPSVERPVHRQVQTSGQLAIKKLVLRVDALESANEALAEVVEMLTDEQVNNSIRFRGYWKAGMECRKGDLVTEGGSLWVALTDTPERPSHQSGDWHIAARKGRDAK